MSSSGGVLGTGLCWPGSSGSSSDAVDGTPSSSSACSSKACSLGFGVPLLSLGALLVCAASNSCAGVSCAVLLPLGGALMGTACSAVLGGVGLLAGGGDAGGCFASTR